VQEALFYKREKGNRVKCLLCPWLCVLKPGQTGACKVRRNVDGILETMVFNKVAALGIDPIEKKPLYHFMPGHNILSLGMVGCNLYCTFCQNHNLSQCHADEYKGFIPLTSGQIVNKASETRNNAGIAFTYNEPFTFYEFMLETAQLAHSLKMKNVVVSNGYVNREPLNDILPFIDAFNIDIKAFSNKFYRQQTKGKLEVVLETIVTIAASHTHLELTNLVIPGLNDNEAQFEEMVRWISGETGTDTPLHISRYFPQYRLNIPATSPDTLKSLYELARKHLKYVYVGNLREGYGSDTFCPGCGKMLIKRNHYTVKMEQGFNGICSRCGTKIQIIL
jgi:pyruvate formate lyase activating enzyme